MKKNGTEIIIPKLLCNEGHPLRDCPTLKELNDPDYGDSGWAGCDVCSAEIQWWKPECKGMFHCDECNYDLCKNCEKEKIRKANMGTLLEQYVKDFNELKLTD